MVDSLTQELQQFPALSKDCNINLSLLGKSTLQIYFVLCTFLFLF